MPRTSATNPGEDEGGITDREADRALPDARDRRGQQFPRARRSATASSIWVSNVWTKLACS